MYVTFVVVAFNLGPAEGVEREKIYQQAPSKTHLQRILWVQMRRIVLENKEQKSDYSVGSVLENLAKELK
jgi:hypothetical protein